MSYKPNILTASITSAPSTASATGVMMGLGLLFTPKSSGAIKISVAGTVKNSTANNGAKIQLKRGTTATPSLGDAVSGSNNGNFMNIDRFIQADKNLPFTLTGYVPGLIVGQQYWFDLTMLVSNSSGGTATIVTAEITIEEQ